MKYQAGFIGAGNMGGALASAVYKVSKNIAVCDQNGKRTAEFVKAHPKAGVEKLENLVPEARFLFLGVKPNVILDVAESVGKLLTPETTVVTMAAGVSLAEITGKLGTEKVIRIMPNTPAAVGEGMILYTMASGVTEEDEKAFLALMQKAGTLDKIDEKLIDAAAALSGCGPAYVYIFAEALADGAVRCGLPRDKALLYAKQTILGSAKMMMESEKHPEALKDDVCSPGGTTIEGVLALEENKFRFAAASAVTAAYDKTAKLKK